MKALHASDRVGSMVSSSSSMLSKLVTKSRRFQS